MQRPYGWLAVFLAGVLWSMGTQAQYGPDPTPDDDANEVTITFEEAELAGATDFSFMGSNWSGGFVGTQGITSLYASGTRSYHAEGGATVTFDSPSPTVRFFYVHGGGSPAGTATFFDSTGTELGSFDSRAATFFDDPDNFLNASFSEPIARIEFSSGVIDDFTYQLSQNGDGAGSLKLTADNYDVQEDAGQVTVEVAREGGTEGAVMVDVATTDGSATEGSDYLDATSPLAWAAGEGGNKGLQVTILDDTETEGSETVNVTLANPTGGASLGSPAAATITILDDDGDTTACVEDDDTLCLLQERFRVEVVFRKQPEDPLAAAQAIPFTDLAGLFHFGNPNNIEMLLKMLNACELEGFNTFWVFFAATTDREFTVTVTDTESGLMQEYSNPLGMAALPVTDTAAFATCP